MTQALTSVRTPDRTSAHGWTLAELLISLALMSVLTAVALPTYQQHQRQVRRGDGQAALMQLQMDQARWRSTNGTYASSVNELGWTRSVSPQGHYQISVNEATADGYTAQATALGTQAADRECPSLRVNWQGPATAVLSAGEHPDSDPASCWRR